LLDIARQARAGTHKKGTEDKLRGRRTSPTVGGRRPLPQPSRVFHSPKIEWKEEPLPKGVCSIDGYPMTWQYIHLVVRCLEISAGEARDRFHRTHLGTLPPDPRPSLGARRPQTHPTRDQESMVWSPASTINHGQYTSLHEDVAVQPELDDVYLDLDHEAQDHSS